MKRLVELHDGSVWANSEGEGHGSQFIVRLPILIESSHTPRTPHVFDEKTISTKCRILVVDDNRDAATTLGMLLKISGNEVRIAHDGQEALGMAEEFHPEVILLDIGMPVLNGYGACRAIRELPWGKEVLIIALTGWGQDDDRKKSQEAGFDGHLVKPVDHGELMKLLAKG